MFLLLHFMFDKFKKKIIPLALSALSLFSFNSCNNNSLNVDFKNEDFFLEAVVSRDGCFLDVDGSFYGSFEGRSLDVYVSDGSHVFDVVCGDDSVSLKKDVSLVNGYSLLGGSAVSYWGSIGGSSSVDVSVYDSNGDGGFSNFERDALDFFKRLLNDGFSSSSVQGFVNYFSRVGPITAFSLIKSYDSFKYFSQFNPGLFFVPEVVGWIDVDSIVDVKNVDGRNFLFPNLFSDPNVSGLSRLNSYPINEYTTNPGLEDLLPDSEDMETCFSKFYGFSKLKSYGENYSNNGLGTSSLDLSFDRDKILSLPQTPGYYNIAPIKGKVIGIATYRDRNEWEGYSYDDISLSVEVYIPPTDRKLFDTKNHKLWFNYNHIALEGKTNLTVEEYSSITGIREGSIILPEQKLGVIQYHMGNSQIIADSSVNAIGNTPELSQVTKTVPWKYKGKDIFVNTLDPTCGYMYPDHFKANTTNVALNQDLSMYAPSPFATDLGMTYYNIPNGLVFDYYPLNK